MKISHIIAIIIIAVAIGVIISTTGDASQYVSYKEAVQIAKEDGDAKEVHVVGTLKKDKNGNIVGMTYLPMQDPNYFSFMLVDNNGESFQVIYNKGKKQDIEKSEKVVVVGSVKNNVFVADDILMKCPSKYENQPVKAEL